MKNCCQQPDRQGLTAGIALLRRPVLPLVSMVHFLFITGSFATVAEVIAEMPEPIETEFALYAHPRRLLRRHQRALRLLESIKSGIASEIHVIDDKDEYLDNIQAISSLCLQQILTDELEEINSLLCAPCGCDLCCTGPTSSMMQEFFEIPLQDSEVDLFPLHRHDTEKSRTWRSQDEPSLQLDGLPFYAEKTPRLFHWRNGWSLILPTSSQCPNLDTKHGRCLIYEDRPEVCRRPQIFPYIVEKVTAKAKRPAYRLRNTLLAVIDCPYVDLLQEEIAAYAAACSLEVIFKQNKV